MKHKRLNQMGFSHIGLIILAIIIILLIVFVGYRVVNNPSINPAQSIEQLASGGDKNDPTGWQAGCQGDDKVKMAHMPMEIDDVDTVSPMGLTAGAHVTPIDHLYFYPKESPRDKYPVYAMADGTIIDISVRGVNVDSGESRPPEYRLIIQHSCQTISYFDLVTRLDDSILSQAPEAATKGTRKRIEVKAGQEIGRIGAQSLDTAIYNMDLTLPGFIHPDLYRAEPWKVHSDDFFAYFDEPLLGKMLAKNGRKAEPRSGKIDYDQPGKLIGNWFKEGTNGYAGPDNQEGIGSGGRGYWSGHLAIFYDAYKPDTVIISFGEYGSDGRPMFFSVRGNKPDPASVDSSSGVIKYQLVSAPNFSFPDQWDTTNIQGTVLFQVLEGEKLHMQVFPGQTADQVKGFSKPVVYVR